MDHRNSHMPACLPEACNRARRHCCRTAMPFDRELRLSKQDKTSIGPYRQIPRRMITTGKLKDEEDIEEIPNAKLFEALPICGRSPDFFVSSATGHYSCISHVGHDRFAVPEVGRLDLDAMRWLFAARPVIEEMQELSVFGVIEKYRELVPEPLLTEIHEMRESIRFAGCSICLSRHE